jgi:hypothetical protein
MTCGRHLNPGSWCAHAQESEKRQVPTSELDPVEHPRNSDGVEDGVNSIQAEN